jgi:hypothetical protein
MQRHRLMAPALILASLASGSVLATACSSTSAGPSDGGVADAAQDADDRVDGANTDAGGDAGESITSKCDRLFDAALSMAKRCGPPPGTEPSAVSYHASDRTNYVSTCVSQASSRGYDLSRLDECVAEAVATQLCVDFIELAAPTNPNYSIGAGSSLASCMQRAGTLGAGAGCAYGSQCASAKCDTGASHPAGEPSYCGTCAAPSGPLPAPVPVGGVCSGTSTCASGAYCEGTCKMPPGKGESCTARCASGLACTGIDPATRVCKPRAPLNGSCAGGGYCQSPLTCANDTCVQGPLGHAGDDCSFGSGIDTLCTDDTVCMGDMANPNKRTCVSIQSLAGQVGEACSPSTGRACAASLWCVQSTCQVRDGALCLDVADAGASDAGPADGAADGSADAQAD